MDAELLEAGYFGYDNPITARSVSPDVGFNPQPDPPGGQGGIIIFGKQGAARGQAQSVVYDPLGSKGQYATSQPDPVAASARQRGREFVHAGKGYEAGAVSRQVTTIAKAIVNTPALRGKPAQQIAKALGTTPAVALKAKDEIIKSLARPSAPKGTPNVALPTVGPHIYLRLLTKRRFQRLLTDVPALKSLPTDTLRIIAGGPGGGETGALSFTSVPPVYVVESGDFPSKIAQKLTGESFRWPELVAANSPPKSKGSDGNFKTLFAGEKLQLPVSWLPLVASQAPPGSVPGFPAPTVPSVPGFPAPTVPSVPGFPAPTVPGSVPTGQFHYKVQSGDFPVKIAQKLTGEQHRWPELVAENVPPKSKDPKTGNFKTLFAGELLKVPLSWNAVLVQPPPTGLVPPASAPSAPPVVPGPSVPSVPPPVVPGPPVVPSVPPPVVPGPVVTAPPVPSVPPDLVPIPVPVPNNPGTTMAAGLIFQTQGLLAQWRELVPGVCNPADYGKTVAEFTGLVNPRFTSALQSFQVWYNQTKPLSSSTAPASLRGDGVADAPSHTALDLVIDKLTEAGAPKKKAGAGALIAVAAAALLLK